MAVDRRDRWKGPPYALSALLASLEVRDTPCAYNHAVLEDSLKILGAWSRPEHIRRLLTRLRQYWPF